MLKIAAALILLLMLVVITCLRGEISGFICAGTLLFLLIILLVSHKRIEQKGTRFYHEAYSIFALIVSLAIIASWEKQCFFEHSTVVGIASLVGIGMTIAGLHIAYRQMKMQEDKIYSYDILYDELGKLLDAVIDDRERRRIAKFYFYGSTPIAGHHVHKDNKDDLLMYRKKLNIILTSEYKEDAVFITFNDELTTRAYSMYGDYNERSSELAEVAQIKRELLNKERCRLIELSDENKFGLLNNYFFSNGKTAIYVVPLQYMLAQANTKTNVMNDGIKKEANDPVLIGFKTTDRIIVNAFIKEFKKLEEKLQAEGDE